ncbi:hypothetical protein K435DRAFT_962366 [Dendrothele bispora CBS 962.96]|uniref:Uncharacterized protein n=1 Tax=Dendrothele bispora (strain CBS 962.96) TaxID=1314807 RepID=A0A4S8MKU3_DENBC|nr:hypothetical protein K435DRAFT_962366 [Dendrothele bispora CBS 962.96]
MSLGEADGKFPDTSPPHDYGIPPSPTRENPAGVYPKSDPSPARPGTLPGTGSPGSGHSNSSSSLLIGNPYLMREAFRNLDSALGRVIEIMEQEEAVSVEKRGDEEDENNVLHMFRRWRHVLDDIRTGHKTPDRSISRSRASAPKETEGGMFVD